MNPIEIREIRPEDDVELGTLIRKVLEEMDAPKTGTAYADPYLFQLSDYYTAPRRSYYILTDGLRIYGGGGYGDLPGAEETTCEIQKMYFDSAIRGKGWGRRLIEHVMEQARAEGYKKAYIETLESMISAQKLYEKIGFKPLPGPLGSTGHCSCPIHLIKDL